MNAITSYFRHAVVVGVLFFVSKYKLPVDGAEELANGLALMSIGTLTWAAVKYFPDLAKRIGLVAVLLMALPGCTDFPLSVSLATPPGTLTYAYSAKGGMVIGASINYDK